MTDRTHPDSGSIISSSDILLHDAKTALMYEELRAAIDDGHESMTHADALAEIAAIRAENVELRAHLEAIAASAGSEPVAWRVHPFDYGIGSQGVYAITSLPQQRDAWLRKGWKAEPLYAHPSPPEGMVGGWMPIETAPEGQMVVVGWLDQEDHEHPERHDFDLLEEGCWQKWHEHAEHVEIIGGHGVSYTPPYTVWMPVGPIPTTSSGSGKGE